MLSDKNILVAFYHKHLILCNILMMGIVMVFLGFFAFFFIDVWTNHGNTTVVPEVRKKAFSEALETLESCDLEVEIADSIYDTSMAPGMVKEVWPRPGARVKPGRTVYLTINSFQPQRVTVTMPLTGVSSRQAMTYLESLNIRNVRITHVPSNFPDLVEGAKYKGKNIVPGMQIPVNANVVLEVGAMPAGQRQKPVKSHVQDETVKKEEQAAKEKPKTEEKKEAKPDTKKDGEKANQKTEQKPDKKPAKETPVKDPHNPGHEYSPGTHPDVFD